ncbi:MAG: dolichol phosphate-mannose biosynthesis regulatory protein [Nitrososphaeria archaeon]|nr:dolichol phosphate-mannose biosynthesis regulatory protein [Aigarchaeota archaeon]MCX8187594.1 dolichol phosphate-mannose biosynthesis regulatory protein [Nitrososphaeria archaeon]
MRLAVIVGILIILSSTVFAAFYTLWFFDLLPLDPELAVKIPVLAIVLALCFIAAWVGYVMATAPPRPKLGRLSPRENR